MNVPLAPVRLPSTEWVPLDLPHEMLGSWLNGKFDENVRAKFFRGMEFESPAGDPGWFGPDSATWYVHSHTPALIFGLQCASYLERLDPSIFWMGMHHSRLVRRREDGTPTMSIDPDGAMARLGHSLAFFMGTAYGSTDSAERLARTVRAMHHTIKGVRPDGATYDADDPDWLRWNYATVVWGSRRRTRSTTRAHCAGPNSTGTTGSSCAWGIRSVAPTCRPPRRRPWNVSSRISRVSPSHTATRWPRAST
ncbi:hypothetical protein GOAMI_15_00900 [Gordonia amicalis NBRC 100051 = JCM 11271]|nr:hypothetical protein GOAMI_15_00900 [Gordonia amicalis NBRC 100051 = JCM 11271]